MADFQNQVGQAVSKLSGMETRIRGITPQAAAEGARIVRDEAKRRAPRLSGRLRDSIGIRPGETVAGSATYVVFAGVFYATFVEYGTSKTSARPFLRPAIDAMRGRVLEVMQRVITANDGV